MNHIQTNDIEDNNLYLNHKIHDIPITLQYVIVIYLFIHKFHTNIYVRYYNMYMLCKVNKCNNLKYPYNNNWLKKNDCQR